MRVLDMRSHDLRGALEVEPLRGKRLIGRGRFSLVFDGGPDTAIKVTIDPGAVQLLTRRGRKPQALPRVVRDHGVIAVFRGGAPIRALEVEKLKVMRASSRNYRLASAICRNFKKHADEEWFSVAPEDFRYAPVLKRAMPDLRKMPNMSPEILATLGSIVRFVDQKRYDVDLHIKNFMDRPATGELVISDPVVCRDMAKFL